jgi:hypothetical protein
LRGNLSARDAVDLAVGDGLIVPEAPLESPPSPLTLRRTTPWHVVAPILALQICLWLVLFVGAGLFRAGPNGKSLATDFAVFSGAAEALKHGANPYDHRVLYRYEWELMLGQHLPVTSNVQNVRAGNPPLFYWALSTLNRFPFQTVALAWIAFLFLVSGAGLVAALCYFGWSYVALPLAVFLLMPQVVLGAAYGNIHGLILAALAVALLLGRRYPLIAGIVLGYCWLKPQLAIPLAALIVLFHASRPIRVVAGFSLATAAELVLTCVTVGPAMLVNWLGGLASWSHSTGSEPNLASLVGLYAGWASYPLRLFFTSLTLAFAVAVTARVWWTLRGAGEPSFLSVAWLWCVWFLAAPFAHFPDEILLAIPIVALVGRDASRLGERSSALVLYLCLGSLILFPSTAIPVNVLCLVVVVITYIVYRAGRSSENATL